MKKKYFRQNKFILYLFISTKLHCHFLQNKIVLQRFNQQKQFFENKTIGKKCHRYIWQINQNILGVELWQSGFQKSDLFIPCVTHQSAITCLIRSFAKLIENLMNNL